MVCSDQDHVKTSNFRESSNIMLNVKVLLFTIYFNTLLTDPSMLTFKKVLNMIRYHLQNAREKNNDAKMSTFQAALTDG